MHDKLTQYPALVTGASSGIGLACAKQLTEQGVEVIITGRDNDQLTQAKHQISRGNAGLLHTLSCDHSQKDAIDEFVQCLKQQDLRPLSIVCNVGVNSVHHLGPTRTHATAYDVFLDTVTTNLINTFYLLSQFLNEMKHARFGRIVLLGSQAYRMGMPGQVSYNSAKSGLVGLKNTIVSEYQKYRVYCHLLNPGVVLNERTRKLRHKWGDSYNARPLTETRVAAEIVRLLDDTTTNGQEVDIT